MTSPAAAPEPFMCKPHSWSGLTQCPQCKEIDELFDYPKSAPRQSDPSMVICPACVHEFRAIPEDVQADLASLRQEVGRLEGELAKWRKWVPADESLADLQQQYLNSPGSKVAVNVYVKALEANVRAAEADKLDAQRWRNFTTWCVADNIKAGDIREPKVNAIYVVIDALTVEQANSAIDTAAAKQGA